MFIFLNIIWIYRWTYIQMCSPAEVTPFLFSKYCSNQFVYLPFEFSLNRLVYATSMGYNSIFWSDFNLWFTLLFFYFMIMDDLFGVISFILCSFPQRHGFSMLAVPLYGRRFLLVFETYRLPLVLLYFYFYLVGFLAGVVWWRYYFHLSILSRISSRAWTATN